MNHNSKLHYAISPTPNKQPGRMFKSVESMEGAERSSRGQPDAFDLLGNGYSGTYYKERGLEAPKPIRLSSPAKKEWNTVKIVDVNVWK